MVFGTVKLWPTNSLKLYSNRITCRKYVNYCISPSFFNLYYSDTHVYIGRRSFTMTKSKASSKPGHEGVQIEIN